MYLLQFVRIVTHFVPFLKKEPHFPWLSQVSIRTLLSILIKISNRIIFLLRHCFEIVCWQKKNAIFAWVRLKMCFEIQKKWLNMWKRHFWIVAIARSLFFPILPCMQKVNICSLGHSAAMFGTFVYSVHDMPIGCVCCQLSLLPVDSWHGYCCFFGQFRRSGGTIRSFTTWGTG